MDAETVCSVMFCVVDSQVYQGRGQSVGEGGFAVSGVRWVPEEGGVQEGGECGVLLGV